MHTYEFKSIDTWFFKQALAPDALSAQEYGSDFPPSSRTMIGALRAMIGESMAVNWAAYRKGTQPGVEKIIGSAADAVPPGATFSGPWITLNQQRYFPAPLHWPAAKDNNDYLFTRLIPRQDSILCDLGRIRLPRAREKATRDGKVSQVWLSREAIETLLSSNREVETITSDQVLQPQKEKDAVIIEEPRLGIARINAMARANDGMLYQTRHLRMSAEAALELDCAGWNPPTFSPALMTFGGEARLACITQREYQSNFYPQMNSVESLSRFSLTLTTPAHFASGSWCPDGFVPDASQTDSLVWVGRIAGVPVRLISAVVGSPQRCGGWSMAQGTARAVVSLVPPGSTYFFEVIEDTIQTEQLNQLRIGKNPELGLGTCAVGIW